MEDAYRLLGLTPGASLPEIRRAYAERLKRTRPDADAKAFAALRAAYEFVVARLRYEEPQASAAPTSDDAPSALAEQPGVIEVSGDKIVALVAATLELLQPLKDPDAIAPRLSQLLDELSFAERAVFENELAIDVAMADRISAHGLASAAHVLGWSDVLELQRRGGVFRTMEFNARLHWALAQAADETHPEPPLSWTLRLGVLWIFCFGAWIAMRLLLEFLPTQGSSAAGMVLTDGHFGVLVFFLSAALTVDSFLRRVRARMARSWWWFWSGLALGIAYLAYVSFAR